VAVLLNTSVLPIAVLDDALTSSCPVLASVAILDELEQVIGVGFANLQLQKSPHLALVSKNFYEYVACFSVWFVCANVISVQAVNQRGIVLWLLDFFSTVI
jgi:hypothetical protein